MDPRYFYMALSWALCCVGFWFFADTIVWSQEQRQLIEQSTLNNIVIRIGPPDQCGVNVNLSVWPDMNQLQVYRWVIACEEASK